jgi:hypothetical protein
VHAPRCFNAYIDEAGDEGFHKLGQRGQGARDASSEWLVLAGVLMFEEQDRERTQAVDRLRVLLNKTQTRSPLHRRHLRNDHSKKRRAMNLLAREPLIFSIVALWKPALVDRSEALKRKGYLYNYAARYLIERLSWFAARGGRRLNLFFESRATTSYADLQSYTLVVGARKTHSRRTVRLLAPLRSDLAEWRLAQGRPDDREPVIPGERGAWSAEGFNKWRGRVFAPALARAGLEPARPYDLRHSFASLLLHEGRSVIYVARQLGHGAELTMRTYGHVIDELEDAPRLPAEEAIRAVRERGGVVESAIRSC